MQNTAEFNVDNTTKYTVECFLESITENTVRDFVESITEYTVEYFVESITEYTVEDTTNTDLNPRSICSIIDIVDLNCSKSWYIRGTSARVPYTQVLNLLNRTVQPGHC